MKLNVAEIICKSVENALTPPFPIYADTMPDADKDCACLRHDPAPAAEMRFADGSRLLKWNLTFYIRCGNAEAARDGAKAMTDLLEGAAITDPETGTRIDTEAATLPQFIGVDDKGKTTYGAAVTASYLEESEGEAFPFD
ncbi:MAG: hypothetical protein NC548_31060 [Lachnospiraceae bacterium]|nr:hypothetical protein [Lachnospiraceae bacterium]MCM1232066.1 hypothetical protein [Ruminococcus flavefaciens]